MNIRKSIAITSLSLIIGGLLAPSPSYAKKVDRTDNISQANTQHKYKIHGKNSPKPEEILKPLPKLP